MFFHESRVFSGKKSPRQGCTKPKTELGCTKPPHFQSEPPISNENPSKHPIIDFLRSAAEAAAYKLKFENELKTYEHHSFADWERR